MKNDPLYNRLREASWRRKLTGAEAAELQTWLAAHPEEQADWETEAGLNEFLERLPSVPVPSNFTARVLQAAERVEAAGVRQRTVSWRAWRWWPRLGSATACAGILVSVSCISYHHFRQVRRTELARGVEAVTEVSSLPSPEILKDFDAIRAMPASPGADLELLALLK
jgi:ferric-dicitrate binding protein FerR (iron transport regulator)